MGYQQKPSGLKGGDASNKGKGEGGFKSVSTGSSKRGSGDAARKVGSNWNKTKYYPDAKTGC